MGVGWGRERERALRMQGVYCRSKKDLLDSKKKATIEKKRPTVEKSYLVCCALKCFLRSGK
jgi:hypothetical protein